MLSLRQSIRFFKPATRTLCSSRYLL
nr:Chain C, COX4 isoform 1 [Saccharomyces cerevisiae]